MGKFDNCLLASDIDGTLVASNYLNPKNIVKIKEFIKEGGKFALSTGRAMQATKTVVNSLKGISIAPSVLINGGMIYDFNADKPLYDVSLPDSDKETVKRVFDFDKSYGIEIHSGGKAFTVNRTSETDLHQSYEEFDAPIITYEEALKYSWNKAIFFCNDEKHRENVANFINIKKYSSNFVSTCAIIDKKMRFYYEQLPDDISKYITLKRLCDILNIKKGGFFAIGDYFNDLEMIENSDIGAATADSPDEVKSKAQFVSCACKDGAVADFIDYLFNKV